MGSPNDMMQIVVQGDILKKNLVVNKVWFDRVQIHHLDGIFKNGSYNILNKYKCEFT